MKPIMKYMSCLFAAAVTGLAAQPAMAAYPDRPIKLIVPFPAGGTTDSVARFIAQELSDKLSQQVVVDYKAGAATIIGAEHTAKSEPDGYTLMLGTATTFTVNPILYPDLSYDPIKSFTPIGIVGTTSLALLANKTEPANDLKTLLDEMRKTPGEYSYGSHGNGTTVHFAAEMLWSAAKVDVVHIPFKGASPALTNLMGGQIPISFDAVPAAATALKSGRIKAIAVTGPERSPALPDVPTVAESGFPGFAMQSWFALVAPKGLPEQVQATLENALESAMSEPSLVEKLTNAGLEPKFEGSADYVTRVKADIAKLEPIAKANNITRN
ncbi:tripartite tricarboxylate transporter substrate binding protein [Pusillimonas sp. SM2304]|uniref:Bug family tripartite tricarboxylate transporter substrate binding protein n=1 Tax=Pusillimonas sp. SM2304 TaxID=3073241 RepID=UPI0028765F72|nr:tripartite tricarboxylate transporter substrate binding protein [Pusillimonas sp. SM2304]MDS1140441.1 tripartite tricarboxylate transporter substrate binding protein [Pusillimonas sp. SM2304]